MDLQETRDQERPKEKPGAIEQVLLLASARKGDLKGVEEALASGADPNGFDLFNTSVLMAAAIEGHVEVVKRLIKAGAKVDLNHPKGQMERKATALMHAARMGQVEVMKALKEAGANVKAKAMTGETALMWAAREGKEEAIRWLLGEGLDPNEESKPTDSNKAGTIAVIEAVTGNHERCALMLAEVTDFGIQAPGKEETLASWWEREGEGFNSASAAVRRWIGAQKEREELSEESKRSEHGNRRPAL